MHILKASVLSMLFFIYFAVSCRMDSSGLIRNKDITTSDSTIFELKKGPISLIVDAANGARVVSLKFDTVELLTSKKLHKENYGSTFWISPQSDWGWPPYPVLDVEPYKAEWKNDKLVLTSAEDLKSGYQVRKEFEFLPENGVLINYTIKNISQSIKFAAPWEVTRVPVDGLSFFPGSQEQVLEKSSLVLEEHEGIMWYPFYETEKSRKVFANGKEGWLAHVHQDVLFVKAFEDILPKDVAPEQEEVEIYAHYNNTYIELENQGVYQQLQPGDSLVWSVRWYLKQVPQHLSVESKNMALLEEVRQLIGL